MSINTAKTILGGLLPFASNPVVLTVIGVGAATWAIASLFDDEDKETSGSGPQKNRSMPQGQPFKGDERTVHSTVQERLETVETTVNPTVELTVQQASNNSYKMLPSLETMPTDDYSKETQTDAIRHDEEAAKKELIRQAMSELGKRSGAARRQKTQGS